MEFGLDSRGNRVSIFDSDPKETYYCPCCKEKLIPKRGKLVIYHFAHKSLENCVGYYDNKGEWHRKMQDLFPPNNREVFNNDFGKHFYDVLTDGGTIIEFQNSPIGYDAFLERTNAYVAYAESKHSGRPIWVFNYNQRRFWLNGTGKYSPRNRKLFWERATKIFGEYKKRDAAFELWFRVSPIKTIYEDFWEHEVRMNTGYVQISAIYQDKFVYGNVFSEKEFEEYLKSIK